MRRGFAVRRWKTCNVLFTTRETDARCLSLETLRRLFGDAYIRDFSIRLWDGTRIAARENETFELRLAAPHALRSALMPPIDLNPGRAFAEGLLDVGGSVEAAVDALESATHRLRPAELPRILGRLMRLPKPPHPAQEAGARLRGRRHTRARDAAAIGFHYDQPVAFYRTFLGETLVYSCAYWDEGVTTLERAQTAKIDYILRKAGVTEGSSVLDVGCGWGSLVIRAAEKFGARATGITLSRAQFDEGRRRIAERGLHDRARIELADYRELGGLTFDAVVSVGMAEHVGREKLPTYFRSVMRALRPGGLFLNHAIADQGDRRRGWRANGFMDRYVFPDGDLVALSQMNLIAERSGLEIRDVENLREHYALTTRHWVANLERNREAAIAATDERTYRIWRLYLAGSGQGFRTGRMGIFQTLLLKPEKRRGRDLVPLIRRRWYE